MKNSIAGLLLLFSSVSIACDNCNIYLNFSPNDYQNSIGIYFRQRSMFGEYNLFGEMITTKHTGHGNDKAFWGRMVDETYQIYEIRANYYFRERWKTTIILPFVNNSQKLNDSSRYQLSGVGDPFLIQSYQVFSTKRDTAETRFFHRLMVGGGVKFPLGKTNLTNGNITPNLDLQPGSGSWDLLLYGAYTARFKFLGINANLSLKKNGRDQNAYHYGNTLNAAVNAFADLSLKNTTIRIFSGIYTEKAKMDDSRYDVNAPPVTHLDTGGKTLFLNAGIQFFTPKITVFGEFQNPIKTEMNGFTQLITKNKINLGITYNF